MLVDSHEAESKKYFEELAGNAIKKEGVDGDSQRG